MRASLILFLLLFYIPLLCQSLESRLPIVIVETEEGVEILDEPKTNGFIKIIYNGVNRLSSMDDTTFHFTSNIGIEIRGESSQSFPKKSYLFETWDENGEDVDASFLNFPSEEDFILYAPYSDKTLLNNALAMNIANEMGRYSSRTRHVELILNGEYQGVYVLMEKIKRDNDRVDISNLKKKDTIGDELTGGYIFRIDKGDHQGWKSKYKSFGKIFALYYQFYYPDENDIQPKQISYISSYMDEFEDATVADNYTNNLGKRYSDYIDLRSFIDHMILSEFAKNVDAYRLSSYFHKDKDSKGGKLTASPMWDFNLSFGNAEYCDADITEGLMYYQCGGGSPFWWDKMLRDKFFINGLRCRYESLREDVLSEQRISEWIDEMYGFLKEPAERNYLKWPTLGEYVWPNPTSFAEAQTYEEVISIMKDFIFQRIEWLDENFPGESKGCDFYDILAGQSTDMRDIALQDATMYVYPNPSRKHFVILGSSTVTEVRLFNTLGQLVDKQNADNIEYKFEIGSHILPGTYILTGLINEKVIQKKVVIQ